MKLYITNKLAFEQEFDNEERMENSRHFPLTSNEIHKKTFTQLYLEVGVHGKIPIEIYTPADGNGCMAMFEFQTRKDGIYFYEFKNVVL